MSLSRARALQRPPNPVAGSPKIAGIGVFSPRCSFFHVKSFALLCSLFAPAVFHFPLSPIFVMSGELRPFKLWSCRKKGAYRYHPSGKKIKFKYLPSKTGKNSRHPQVYEMVQVMFQKDCNLSSAHQQ